MNIVDMALQQGAPPMNAQAPQVTPEVTERAQIVFVFTTPQPPNIQRFNSLKKGIKEYERVKKAWQAWHNWSGGKRSARFLDVDGDMFSSCIDLNNIACLSFVDQAKRQKFVPFQG